MNQIGQFLLKYVMKNKINISFINPILNQTLYKVHFVNPYISGPRLLLSRTLTSVKRKKPSSDKPIMFSFKNAFKDNIRHEPMVSLGNSFELLRLVRQLG